MGRLRLEREQKFIMKVRLQEGYQVCALSWVSCWRLDRDLDLAKQMGKQVNEQRTFWENDKCSSRYNVESEVRDRFECPLSVDALQLSWRLVRGDSRYRVPSSPSTHTWFVDCLMQVWHSLGPMGLGTPPVHF